MLKFKIIYIMKDMEQFTNTGFYPLQENFNITTRKKIFQNCEANPRHKMDHFIHISTVRHYDRDYGLGERNKGLSN